MEGIRQRSIPLNLRCCVYAIGHSNNYAALIVLGVLAVVIFRVRSQSSQSRTRDRMQVKSVTSVGISAQTPKTSSSSGSGARLVELR